MTVASEEQVTLPSAPWHNLVPEKVYIRVISSSFIYKVSVCFSASLQLGRWSGVVLAHKSLSLSQAGILPFFSVNRGNIYHLFNNFQTPWTFGDKDEFPLSFLVSLWIDQWQMEHFDYVRKTELLMNLNVGIWGYFPKGVLVGVECKGTHKTQMKACRSARLSDAQGREGVAIFEPYSLPQAHPRTSKGSWN